MAQPAWQDALESQLDAITSLKRMMQIAPPDMRYEQIPAWRRDLVLLKSATPFAWNKDTVQAVMRAGNSIPLDTTLNIWNLDTNAVWWKFDHDLPITTVSADLGVRAFSFGWVTERDIRHLDEKGNLIRVDEKYLHITAWIPGRDIDLALMASQSIRWEDGTTLGDMLHVTRERHRAIYGPNGAFEKRHGRPAIENEDIIGEDAFLLATEQICRFILAGLAWINQRILITEIPSHIERHARKRLLKATDQKISHVKVVQLRRADYGTHEPGDGTREYSVRWIVEGHWRNQPCGIGLSDRRMIWISPYVKGPEDAPLKVPEITVYRVSR